MIYGLPALRRHYQMAEQIEGCHLPLPPSEADRAK